VTDGQKRTSILAALLMVLAAIGVQAAVPAHADPSVESMQKKVEDLYHQAEIATEHYDAARDRLKQSRTQLDALDADMARQQAVVDTMRQQVAQLVVQQYQGQSLSTAGQVVLSDNPDKFLDNLNAVSSYDDQRAEMMGRYRTQLQRLQLRKAAVAVEVSQLTRTKKSLATRKAYIDAKAAKAKEILDGLKAKQRAAVAGPTVATPAVAPASGRAAAAVQFAMAQVGKAYVFGAAGPSAYDCSGLTMAAWGAAGVSLPHSSSAQYGMGPHISESQLQPGDLVFYYSPISHVGMYIGNGMIVNAENPSAGVKVTSLHEMPYVGAVRPG
jgi:peptidoglycan DL-endopeptidase CwlO